MLILNILMVIWFFDRSKKLKETRDIEKYVLVYPRKIKDRDGYIKLYSKMYFWNGIILTLMEVFFILIHYFDLPGNVSLILLSILFIESIIQAVLIKKKSKEFT